MHGPREQWEHRSEEECTGALEPHTPRPGQQQWNDAEGEQNGVPGPHEREHGDSEADEGEAADRRRERGSHDEERPAREGRGEHGLARQLVEHERVALVGEKSAATAIATRGPKKRAAAAQQTIEPA